MICDAFLVHATGKFFSVFFRVIINEKISKGDAGENRKSEPGSQTGARRDAIEEPDLS